MEQQSTSKVSILLTILITAILVAGGMYYFQSSNSTDLEEESLTEETENQTEEQESALALVPNTPQNNNSQNTQVSQPANNNQASQNQQDSADTQEQQAEQPEEAEPTIYTNARYRFSLALPAAWGQVKTAVTNPQAPQVEADSQFQPVVAIESISFQSEADRDKKFIVDVYATSAYKDGLAGRTVLHQDDKYTISLSVLLRNPDVVAEVNQVIIPSFKKL